jgi:hypothetical protein
MKAEGATTPGGPLSGRGIPAPKNPIPREGRDVFARLETATPATPARRKRRTPLEGTE